MAKVIRGVRGPAGAGGWRESKALIPLLLLVIVGGLAFAFLRTGSTNTTPKEVTYAYWDTDIPGPIQLKAPIVDQLPPFFNPELNPLTKKRTLWNAYACTNPQCKNEDGSPFVFSDELEFPPGAEPPKEGEGPSPKYLEFLFNKIDREIRCPKCGLPDFVEPYKTKETQAAEIAAAAKKKKR
ncbi:MAG: hypothetical protein V1918_01170 [Planctomycetota bacterium]